MYLLTRGDWLNTRWVTEVFGNSMWDRYRHKTIFCHCLTLFLWMWFWGENRFELKLKVAVTLGKYLDHVTWINFCEYIQTYILWQSNYFIFFIFLFNQTSEEINSVFFSLYFFLSYQKNTKIHPLSHFFFSFSIYIFFLSMFLLSIFFSTATWWLMSKWLFLGHHVIGVKYSLALSMTNLLRGIWLTTFNVVSLLNHIFFIHITRTQDLT